MTHANMLKLLTTRRFLPFFSTQFLSALNDCIYRSALIVLVTYQFSSSKLLVSLASALFILPFFIFSSISGQVADKFNKTSLTRAIKCFEAGLMGLAAVGFYQHNVWLLMTVLMLMGVHSAFFSPIKYAILPELLATPELLAANALIEAGTFIPIILGTIIGSMVVSITSYPAILSGLTITIALLGLISSFWIPAGRATDPAFKIDLNIAKSTGELVRHSYAQKRIFLCIMGISWFWFLGSAFLSLFPYFTKDTLGGNEHVLTALLTIFSLGVTFGSWACLKLLKNSVTAKYVPLSILMISFCILVLCAVSKGYTVDTPTALIDTAHFLSHGRSWIIMLAIFLIAFFGALYVVPLYTLLQVNANEAELGRVIASNNLFSSLFMVLSSLFIIILLSMQVSITQSIFYLALLNSIIALYACRLLPHELIQSFLKWLFIGLFKVEVKGLEHYHAAGKRIVIVANHISYLDGLLIAAFLPDKVIFVINALIAEQWRLLKPFLNLVEAFKIAPDKPMSIKPLIKLIRTDRKCLIFPEGRVTLTGSLMKIYEGPGLIADKADAYLLPIRIEGAQYSIFSRLRGKVKIRLCPKITLTILPPLKLTANSDLSGRQRRQLLGNQLYDVMTDMMFKSSPYQTTLFEALIAAKATHGGECIIAEDTQRQPINYQQLITRAFILGEVIKAATRPNEYIGIMLPTSIAGLITFFAAHAVGRIPVLLNFTSGLANLITACHATAIRQIYTSKRFIETARLENVVRELAAKDITIIYLEDLRQKITFFCKLKGLIASYTPLAAYRKYSQATYIAPAAILFTSGSEGKPKGVVLSHENILANRYQLAARVAFSTRDLAFNPLPIFHSFGLTAATLMPVFSGIKVFLFPTPLHYRIIPELIYDIGATIFFGTDTFLAAYARFAHPYDFYTINYVFAGAERVKDETHKIWGEKFGKRILEGYGTTEAAPVIACNTPMQNKRGTVGRFLPGIRYQLQEVPGIADGGRLYVSGINIMLGYILADKPLEIHPPEQGWYDTGDIVQVDEQGYITIKDRAKRFAKIAGEMVSLTAVENTVAELWPGNLHAAINLPDTKKGEKIVLVTNYPQANYDEMLQYFRKKQLTELSIPKQIILKDKIPLLGTGKIDYVAVRQWSNSNANDINL